MKNLPEGEKTNKLHTPCDLLPTFMTKKVNIFGNIYKAVVYHINDAFYYLSTGIYVVKICRARLSRYSCCTYRVAAIFQYFIAAASMLRRIFVANQQQVLVSKRWVYDQSMICKY